MVTSLILNYYQSYLENNSEIKDKHIYMKNFLDMRETNGFSALHCAAFKGDLEIIKLL